VIKEDNPFPGICGRICNHRCEEACNRSLLDEPLNIRALKRFVTDKVYAEEREPPESYEIKYDQRVAIIGAGPCGLTTAQDLCKLGYRVTVFESLPVAGGMLRVGVPEYRLPASIVDREVQDIVDLGVELRLNTFVENLDDVFDEGFDALLIAVGAHEGIRLPIPGADLEGVLVNTVFLRDVRLDNPPQLGKRVAVVGAGDVAMDVARTAVRLGADVSLYYRRTRSESTAGEEEIRHAEEEGVDFNFQVTPVEIVGDENKRMTGITCVRTEQGLPDATGRRQPVPIPGSEHFVPCDNIIFSVGQRAGLAFIPESAGVGITKQATIAVNPNTMAATRPGVFAAGDATTGTAFVIEAVEAGHCAAASIHRYLRGEELESPPKPRLPVVQMSQAEVEEQVIQGEAQIQPRVPMDELPVEQRLSTFEEVVAGYTDEQAQVEAARCLACGLCAECLSCQYECGRDAIDHNMVAREEQFDVGAIILAPGYQTYNAELSAEYSFGRYPNVVTALQFERLLSASGPTSGHVERPSDHKPAQKIAFLQCVGSRDQNHDYCSAVCCMYATKEAIMTIEHEPDTEVHVFMMDMRAFSKGYEAYYQCAQEKYGINYTRCRISEVKQTPGTGNLVVRYASDQGSGIRDQGLGTRDQGLVPSPQSLVPNPQSLIEAEFDLVVLSVGMEISDSVKRLGGRLGVELDEYGFCRSIRFNPIETSRPGIYAVGPFREPKDIPESVVEASGAAAASAGLLAEARWTLTNEREYPPERDVSGETARIGVFVCHCGSNIGGFLDVPDVAEYANTLPNVIHSEDTLYACSQDSIKLITERVEEHKLNRVVVASCTPLTHAPLFQDSIRAAGLNPYLFEMANIRNQCSWVHSDDWDTATTKAKELVRMAIARAALLEPQNMVDVPVHSTALVIGGGAAGMTAAISLAEQGFPVHLVEKEAELGGNLRYVFTLLETGYQGLETNDPQYVLRRLVEQIHAIPNITVHMESQVIATGGFVGNFASTIQHSDGSLKEISHGATILATGAQEYRGTEYGHGSDPRIVTQQEFEELLAGKLGIGKLGIGKLGTNLPTYQPTNLPTYQSTSLPTTNLPNSVVMIQCIGPAEKYCSRICCTVAIKNALALKERNPNAQITILYKDIRTYGFKERLYTKAREHGVIFVRYNDTHEPEVRVGESASQRVGESASRRVSESANQRVSESANQRVGESASQRDSISNPQSPISNPQSPISNPQSPIS
ncbi:MAG: FAD-dependent oxidoreductase, partial [Chloroflexi bacterium]|nr:FAD-dependent oxidoreductase [Chloroflexota bacterium]